MRMIIIIVLYSTDEEDETLALVVPQMQLVSQSVPAKYIPYHERCANDEANLFIPSALPSKFIFFFEQ